MEMTQAFDKFTFYSFILQWCHEYDMHCYNELDMAATRYEKCQSEVLKQKS